MVANQIKVDEVQLRAPVQSSVLDEFLREVKTAYGLRHPEAPQIEGSADD